MRLDCCRMLLVALLCVAAPAQGQEWDVEIQAAMADAGIPGMAVLVIHRGETLMSEGFGVLRAGGDEPVTPETLFQVGSLTKAVTATAVAQLVGAGEVGWDDPIASYVDGFGLADPWVSERITIRDALAMRSGIVGGIQSLCSVRTGGPRSRVSRVD